MLWAVEKGITRGASAATFSPEKACSTADTLTFLYRAYGVGTDGWYEEAGKWAEQNGLLQNTGAHPVPSEQCPRANIVTFLYRMAKSGHCMTSQEKVATETLCICRREDS